jgi:hypothetical protein
MSNLLAARENPALMDMNPIEALARRVAASPADCVLLLERHRMLHFYSLVGDKKASIILKQAGFTGACFELDAAAYAKMKHALGPSYEPRSRKEIMRERIFNDDSPERLTPHMVGNSLLTAREVLEETRLNLGRRELYIERFFVRPESAISKVGPLFHFHNLLEHQRPSAELAKLIVNSSISTTSVFLREARAIGGKSSLQAALEQELNTMYDLAFVYRQIGGCDKSSAQKILDLMNGRLVLCFGAMHGWHASNSASLSEQLVAQAKERGKKVPTIEIVLMTDSANNDFLFWALTRTNVQPNPSVRVYDVEKKLEWALSDWIAAMRAEPRSGAVLIS